MEHSFVMIVTVDSVLSIYCSDREEMIQWCINPIAEGDFAWIYACYCERVNSGLLRKIPC